MCMYACVCTLVTFKLVDRFLQGCIQKFPDRVGNKLYSYNNKHSLRINMKGYGAKTH